MAEDLLGKSFVLSFCFLLSDLLMTVNSGCSPELGESSLFYVTDRMMLLFSESFSCGLRNTRKQQCRIAKADSMEEKFKHLPVVLVTHFTQRKSA